MLTSVSLTVETLRSLLKSPSGELFIDLRDPVDFQAEHIDGFTNVPLGEIFAWQAEQDKKQLVILFCTSGQRASIAADVLRNVGFEQVRIIAGGLLSWKVQNFPLHRSAVNVRQASQ